MACVSGRLWIHTQRQFQKHRQQYGMIRRYCGLRYGAAEPACLKVLIPRQARRRGKRCWWVPFLRVENDKAEGPSRDVAERMTLLK